MFNRNKRVKYPRVFRLDTEIWIMHNETDGLYIDESEITERSCFSTTGLTKLTNVVELLDHSD